MADLTPRKLIALSKRLTRLEQRSGVQQSPPYPAPVATPAELRETLERLIESGAFQPQMARSQAAWWWRLGEALFGPGWREAASATAANAEREERARGDHHEDGPSETDGASGV